MKLGGVEFETTMVWQILTERQREILVTMMEVGTSSEMLARELVIERQTVDHVFHRIYDRMEEAGCRRPTRRDSLWAMIFRPVIQSQVERGDGRGNDDASGG